MSKGDWFRPVDKPRYDGEFERIFGRKELNLMSDEDRDALEVSNEAEADGEGIPKADETDSDCSAVQE